MILLTLTAAVAAPATRLAHWDFEADDGGLLSGGDLPQWEWGVPSGASPAALSGSRLWGTDLDDRYLRENEIWLQLPAFPLSEISQPVLLFWSWLDLASGDFAVIEAWDGVEWTLVAPVYGYPSSQGLPGNPSRWEAVYVDLSAVPDLQDLRLVLRSDAGRAWGWYIDELSLWSGDVVPPQVSAISAPSTWSRFDAGPRIEVEAQDDRHLDALDLVWRMDEGAWQRSPFVAQGGTTWAVELPAQMPGTLSWSIEASDGLNLSTWPLDGAGSTRIFLPAPADLRGPSGRLWGTELALSWTAPEAEEPFARYRLYRDGQPLLETFLPFATAPVEDSAHRFEVSALFTTALGELEGDLSEPLDLSVSIPRLDPLSPAEGFPGETLRVQLSGENLLLDESTVLPADFWLEEGLRVTALQVQHVDRAILDLEIDAAALVGTHDLWLELHGQELRLPAAFTVRDDAERPAILGLDPEAVEQGSQATVRLSLSTPPAGVPTVDLGDGVVVTDVLVQGSELFVEISVANAAAAGPRRVTVDDGQRILERDEAFRVWPRAEKAGRCQVVASPAPLLLVGLLAALRRRSRPFPRA